MREGGPFFHLWCMQTGMKQSYKLCLVLEVYIFLVNILPFSSTSVILSIPTDIQSYKALCSHSDKKKPTNVQL
jgi:hypothetical protein